MSDTTDINEPGSDSLLEQARELPTSVEPPADFWPAIRARVAQGHAPTGLPQARYAAAALILICITSSTGHCCTGQSPDKRRR